MQKIETERLFMELASDEYMEQMIRDEKDEEMKQAYTEMLQGTKANPGQREWNAIWLIKQKSDPDSFIGDMCFKGLSDKGVIEIGYGIHPEYECQGYMTEAVIGIVRWASKQPGVKTIEAEAEESNTASLRVLAKAGFVRNGIMGEEGPRFEWKNI